MDVEIHYGGQIYKAVGGEERATEIVLEVRRTVAAGGGTIDIETSNGSVNCTISAQIPFAVVLVKPAKAW